MVPLFSYPAPCVSTRGLVCMPVDAPALEFLLAMALAKSHASATLQP